MAKKSASEYKVVKKPKKTDEEKFESYVSVEKFKMETAISQSKRIDTWVSLRNDAKQFLEYTPSIEWVNEIYAYETKLLEDMYEDLCGLTFEQLMADDYVDIYAKYVMDPEDCETLDDFWKAFLTYSTVASWAVHLLSLRADILDGTAAE